MRTLRTQEKVTTVKQSSSRRVKIEMFLYMLKMVAPIASVVFVEQQMGPGSDAKASRIMLPLLTLNLILGSLSLRNLMKVFPASTFNKFTTAELILWVTKVSAPFLLMFVIEATVSLGGTARAAQLSPALLLINLTLGIGSMMNTIRAVASVSGDGDADDPKENDSVS